MNRFPYTIEDLSGPQCVECGQCGCSCDPDDQRSYRERVEDEKGEMAMELERGEG